MLNEGETITFTRNNALRGETIETKNIYVDAYGVGDVGNIVLRDRKTISSEGMVVVFLVVNNQGQLLTQPRLISRGFVFEKEESQLYQKAVKEIQLVFKPIRQTLNLDNIKREVINKLEDIFYKEKGRRPLIVAEAIQM